VAKKDRDEKPREYTRRQLSHFKKQKRRQRIIFIGGIAVIIAIVLIVSLGWYLTDYHPMHQTVVRVGDTKFDTAYYIDVLEQYAKNNTGYTVDQLDMYLNLPQVIVQNELIRQAAAPLGITISDADIIQTLKDNSLPTSRAYIDAYRAQQLQTRLKDEYFGIQEVPVTDNQVYMMALMAESESAAAEVRDKILNGDNFTALVDEYAQDSYSKSVNGDYGLHPRSILQNETKSDVPLDYAFGAEVGDVSPPLSDNASEKWLGYWLINVLDRPSDNETTVDALYLSSEEQALEIKARLEAGDNLTALADEYTQYAPSKEKHGELGVLTAPSDNLTSTVSTVFDRYAFDPDTPLGQWSDPLRDTKFSTTGGCWVVQVIDKQIDSKLSDTDRSQLIDNAYSSWLGDIWVQYASEIDTTLLTSDLRDFAVARAEKDLSQTGG
jgi:parvulin-like peptidyl-prolyl isomerase